MLDGIKLLQSFLDIINNLIHNAYSRDPRVITAHEMQRLQAYLTAARVIEVHLPPDRKRPVYTRFLQMSNLARHHATGQPVVPSVPIPASDRSVFYGLLNENIELLPGDDGAPVVWQPTDVERARVELNQAQAEANRARAEANRTRAEADAERLRLNDLDRQIRENDEKLAATCIQRLQFSNDPPLRAEAHQRALHEFKHRRQVSNDRRLRQAPGEGAAFTQGMGARQRALQAQNEAIMDGMLHEMLLEQSPSFGAQDGAAMQQAEGLEASEEELNRQAGGLAAAMHRFEGRTRICASCGKEITTRKKKCCEGVYYCGPECHERNWEAHYLDCGNIKDKGTYAFNGSSLKSICWYMFKDGLVQQNIMDDIVKERKRIQRFALQRAQRLYPRHEMPNYETRLANMFRELLDGFHQTENDGHFRKTYEGFDFVYGLARALMFIFSSFNNAEVGSHFADYRLMDLNRPAPPTFISNDIYPMYNMYEVMLGIINGDFNAMLQNTIQDERYEILMGEEFWRVFRTMRITQAMVQTPNTPEMPIFWARVEPPWSRRMLLAPNELQQELVEFLHRMEGRDLEPKELRRIKRWLNKLGKDHLQQLLTLLLRYQTLRDDRVYSPRVLTLVRMILEINPGLTHFYRVGLDVFQQRASSGNVLRQLLIATTSQTYLQVLNPDRATQQYDEDTMQELALRLQFASIDILSGMLQPRIRVAFTFVVRQYMSELIVGDANYEWAYPRALDILRRFSEGLSERENDAIIDLCAQRGVAIDEPEIDDPENSIEDVE